MGKTVCVYKKKTEENLMIGTVALNGSDNGLGLVESANHLDALLPSGDDIGRFLEEFVEHVGFCRSEKKRKR